MKKFKLEELRNSFNVTCKVIVALLVLASLPSIANDRQHYQLESVISEQVTISDKTGAELGLQKLIADSGAKLSVVFIFGGGGMGHKRADKNGGMWCPDSYEDMHILRSLHNHYQDKVAIIPIAVPPVFHSEVLGYEKGLFFSDKASPDYQTALMAFIDSTQTAFKQGTIPVQPFYDNDFNLLISQQHSKQRSKVTPIKPWHGAFRAADETQHYGVPNLWLVDASGKVIAEPFRGNIYRPHGGDIKINYTLNDVIKVIEANLQ